LFDEARFAELRPAFAELRQGKVLSSAALNAIRAVVDQSDLADAEQKSGLERVLAAPTLPPRAFLSPAELAGVLYDLLALSCYPAGGHWSLVERGENFVVLEHAGALLLDEPWYEDLVSGDSAHSYDLRIPVEGCDAILPNPSVKEVHAKLVALHGAAATKQRLNDLGAQTGRDPRWITSELEEFLQLLKQATSADRWGVAHQILL
jgi:hypothetical protein